MDRILMADIIPLLPLPAPPQGRGAYYVPCPHCDKGRKTGKHMNISFTKNVFRCARCGWNGGIFDLYAYYTGTPRGKVRDVLKRALGNNAPLGVNTPFREPVLLNGKDSVAPPIAGIEVRHAAYGALLSMLSLAPDHMRSLVNRGLSGEAIRENGYRTTPVIGGKALAKKIQGMGLCLSGVPGFYADSGGQWALIPMWRGILIPVRDAQKRIQGLQVRRDNQAKRKYRWVSSIDVKGGSNGAGAEGWIHLAGPARERVILIEGPLKADVVHHLTGQSVLAIPGVNSLKHLEPVLAEMIGLGVKQVMVAFDMDFLCNPHVQNGYGELISLLNRMHIRYGTYLWPPEYNGLDDYIWECCLNSGRDA